MHTCHFCKTTEDVLEYEHMYPGNPEKTICICNRCYKNLKTAKDKAKTKQLLPLTDERAAYIKRWYKHFDYLAQFFDETDICKAILPNAFTQLDDGSICDLHLTQKINIPTEMNQAYYENSPDYEYIGTEYKSVQNTDRFGRAYADYSNKKCAIYRTYHSFQQTIDGTIVLTLLYQKYPELQEFKFNAYAIDYKTESYEIYSKNHVYIPFKALMEGDIDAIKTRNQTYAKSYNNGDYTPNETEKRLNSPETQHLFDVIQNINRKG